MKQVVVLGTVLAVSLVGTYVTWFAEEEAAANKGETVPVFSAGPGDLTGIGWESKKLTVRVEERTDAQGEYLWVKTTTRKLKKGEAPDSATPHETHSGPDAAEPPPAGSAAEPAPPGSNTEPAPPGSNAEGAPPGDPPPAPEAPEEWEEESNEFLGNDAAKKLWESFEPLVALRELIPDASTDRSVFKFEEPEATVTVDRAAGQATFVVGGEAWGSKDRYISSAERIYLVDDNSLRPLQFANMRLMERTLVPLDEPATEAVQLTANGSQVRWTHQNRDDKDKAFWARAEAPEATDPTAGVWLDKVYKLRGASYVAGELPNPVESVFTVAMTGDGKTWTVEVMRETEGEKPEWYARSSYNRALLKLTRSIASDVAADVADVIAGNADVAPANDEPIEAAPEEAAP